MALFLRFTTVVVMLFSLAACSTENAFRQRGAAAYPYRHSDFDLKFAWNTTQAEQGVVVDGVLKNLRYPQIESLNIFVMLLDKDSKVLAEEAVFPIPQVISRYEIRPFALTIKRVALSGGDQLQFLIWYRASEGGEGGYQWLSSFTVDAVTGAVKSEERKSRDDF